MTKANDNLGLFGAGDDSKARNSPFCKANEFADGPRSRPDTPPRGSIAGPEEYPGEDFPSEQMPLTHRAPRPTEAAAAERAKPIATPLRALVLAWVRDAGPRGMTPPELGARYADLKNEQPSARREYSVRPRVTELHDAGYIVEAGGQRDGCTVWIATDKPGDGRDIERDAKPSLLAELREVLKPVGVEKNAGRDLLIKTVRNLVDRYMGA